MLIYLDSNIVIYSIEQPPLLGALTSAKVREIINAGDRIIVSDLTRIECRCGPLAQNDSGMLSLYDEFFSRIPAQVALLSTTVCDRATQIRARFRYKTPDAIHLACALETGCDKFLTNDLRLSGFSDLKCEMLK